MSYFTPRRRKLGVMTLLLACLFAGLWVRGHMVGDDFSFGTGSGMQFHSLRACRTGLNWKTISSSAMMHWITGWNISGIDTEDLSDPLRGHVLAQTYDWRWQGGGFDFGHAHDDAGSQVAYWLIPYWSIVMPLTLLSAWLLLSRPTLKPAAKIQGV